MKKIIICLCAILFCTSALAIENIVSAGVYVSPIALSKKYTDISHSWRTIGKMKTQAKNLSEPEKEIIKKYVLGAVRGEDTFMLINCNLRGTLEHYVPKKEITKPLKYRLDYYANQLSHPIVKTRLPQNILLYKGVDEKAVKIIFAGRKINDAVRKPVNEENLAILKKKLVGAAYLEKGFLSASYDIDCTNQTKFIFEINAPKNLQAILLEDLGKKEEKEVLINSNSKWEITDISIKTSKKTKQDFYLIKLKFVKR